jgi:hypothetical protein
MQFSLKKVIIMSNHIVLMKPQVEANDIFSFDTYMPSKTHVFV